jgi:hypothetical protein
MTYQVIEQNGRAMDADWHNFHSRGGVSSKIIDVAPVFWPQRLARIRFAAGEHIGHHHRLLVPRARRATASLAQRRHELIAKSKCDQTKCVMQLCKSERPA